MDLIRQWNLLIKDTGTSHFVHYREVVLSMDYFSSTSLSGIICTIGSKHEWGVLKSPLLDILRRQAMN